MRLKNPVCDSNTLAGDGSRGILGGGQNVLKNRSPIDGSSQKEYQMVQEQRAARMYDELNSQGLGRLIPFLPLDIPYGVSFTESQRRALNMSPSDFIAAVKTGGIWDFKRLGGQYEDFGNFHFGTVAEATNFIPNVSTARFGAGLYQIWSGTAKMEWLDTFFDDPNDSENISKGWITGELLRQETTEILSMDNLNELRTLISSPLQEPESDSSSSLISPSSQKADFLP